MQNRIKILCVDYFFHIKLTKKYFVNAALITLNMFHSLLVSVLDDLKNGVLLWKLEGTFY